MINRRINAYLELAALTSQNMLFHVTGIYNAMEILKCGNFHLASDLGTGAESNKRHKDKSFYLSCARTMYGRYGLAHAHDGYASFTLRRDVIGHKFSIKPIDYFDGTYRPGYEPQHKDLPPEKEAEDRVYSTSPRLPINGIIEALNVLRTTKDRDARDWRILKDMVILCKKAGIPIYIYTDKSDFLSQNTKNAMPHAAIMEKLKAVEPPEYPDYFRMPRDYTEYWRELYYKKNAKELSKDALGRMKTVVYYPQDSYISLSSDIHNARRYPDIMLKWDTMLKQARVKSLREWLTLMEEKWRPLAEAAAKERNDREHKEYLNRIEQMKKTAEGRAKLAEWSADTGREY